MVACINPLRSDMTNTLTTIGTSVARTYNTTINANVCSADTDLPALGQQTNSAPLKPSMPHGCSVEKPCIHECRRAQDSVVVSFHASYDLHCLESWMWSNRQLSGTWRASLWNGPTVVKHSKPNRIKTRKGSVEEMQQESV